ncbi:MAG: TonB-dependent receptor, partial [Desulfobulbaceae bacterium]|nr:TonB-dependent receptor [Desulfobulbaceae bacterium]
MKKITIIITSSVYLTIHNPFPSIAQADDSVYEEDELLALYYDKTMPETNSHPANLFDRVVETATHAPKPLSQVAENVTIITAEDIERMNAHNVDDVLNRVAGVFVSYHAQDFNGNTFLDIHDSSYQQVAVYLDGVRLSKATLDLTFANVVPVRIIKRIEVIKGTASSTWGSALGGVINIITKDTGKEERPTGSLRGSYGEFGSQDYSGELASKWGQLGYYLSTGYQTSDGLRDDKYFDNLPTYTKFDLDLPNRMILSLSGMYSAPDYMASHIAHPDFDFAENLDDRNSFVTGSFDWMVRSRVNLHLNSYFFENDYQTTGTSVSSGQILSKNTELQKSAGTNGRVDWHLTDHQLVLGFDHLRNKLFIRDELTDVPESRLSEELLAWYVNDTIRFDKFTIIPGLRFDQLSDTDDMLSPSLGTTYQLAEHTLLRAGISRGFRKPPIIFTDVKNGLWYANNDLDPEKVWSYQVGAETGAARFCRLKSTFFLHDVEDAFQWNQALEAYDNNGVETRRGLELELETVPWHNLVMEVNYTYVYLENIAGENNHQQGANLIFRYDQPTSITVELAGHYARLIG